MIGPGTALLIAGVVALACPPIVSRHIRHKVFHAVARVAERIAEQAEPAVFIPCPPSGLSALSALPAAAVAQSAIPVPALAQLLTDAGGLTWQPAPFAPVGPTAGLGSPSFPGIDAAPPPLGTPLGPGSPSPAAVPELAVWALMTAGFGVTGAALRSQRSLVKTTRRRQRPAQVTPPHRARMRRL